MYFRNTIIFLRRDEEDRGGVGWEGEGGGELGGGGEGHGVESTVWSFLLELLVL